MASCNSVTATGKKCSRVVRTHLVQSRRFHARHRRTHGRSRGRGTEVFSVARPRRLRYKLMLGLGLVVGSVALLVGGTLYGIRAYTATVKTTERKMVELQLVNILIETLKGPDQTDPTFEFASSRSNCQLKKFRDENANTVAAGLDPDDGEQEAGLIAQLDEELKQLQDGIAKCQNRFAGERTTACRYGKTPALLDAYDKARSCAEHLRLAIIDDIETGIRRSNKTIRQSQWVVGVATAWARRRSSSPCSTTSASGCSPRSASSRPACSASTAATSSTPSRLTSGDELQELADEFNDMTARLAAIYARPRPAGQRAQPATRPQRAAGVGRLPGRRRRPRDQQPARQHRVLLRGPGTPAARSPDGDVHRRPADRRGRLRGAHALPEDDPGGSVPLQGDHAEAARLQPHRRPQARADRPRRPDPRRARRRPPPAELPRQEDRLRAEPRTSSPRSTPRTSRA